MPNAPALLPPAQEQCQHLHLRAAKTQDRGAAVCAQCEQRHIGAEAPCCAHDAWRSRPAVNAADSAFGDGSQRCAASLPRYFHSDTLRAYVLKYVFYVFHMRSITI